MMLVDSHCHLDFPDFAPDLDGVVARAEAGGIGRMVTISTRVRRHDALLAIAERFPSVFCSVGTHPHHAAEERDVTLAELRRPRRAAEGGRDRRGGARLFLRPQPARRAGARVPHPHRRGARERPAARHPHPRRRRRHGPHSRGGNRQGELRRRAALLHRAAAILPSARSRSGTTSPSPAFSPTRNPMSCARSQRRCRPTASWSKPTRPISPPTPAAASATSPLSWPRRPGCWPTRAAPRSRRSPARPPRIFSGSSPRRRGRTQRQRHEETITGAQAFRRQGSARSGFAATFHVLRVPLPWSFAPLPPSLAGEGQGGGGCPAWLAALRVRVTGRGVWKLA